MYQVTQVEQDVNMSIKQMRLHQYSVAIVTDHEEMSQYPFRVMLQLGYREAMGRLSLRYFYFGDGSSHGLGYYKEISYITTSKTV